MIRRGGEVGGKMEFTYQELAQLNQMIGIALMSGKVDYDEISESIYKKVTQAIYRQAQDEIPNDRHMEKSSIEYFLSDEKEVR